MKKLIFIFILFNLLYLPRAQAARYISIAPSTTEILFALGLEDEVVGVSNQCNYPPQVKNKPRVGNFSSPNAEKISSLEPDYIFATGLEQAPVIEQLRQLNFKVYVADPVNSEGLFRTILQIGEITGRQKEAQLLVGEMRDKIRAITDKTRLVPQDKRPKVFLEIWHEPLMTAAKGSFVDELISFAGGVNIAHNLIRPYCNFSAEKVINLDPDCIILTYMDKEPPLKLVKTRFGWDRISAIRTGRVFNDINPDVLLRPGPRITQGLEQLYSKFYPEQK